MIENTFKLVEDSASAKVSKADFNFGHKRIFNIKNTKKDLSMLFTGKMDWNSIMDSRKNHRDYVTVEVRDKDGNLKERRVSHNLRTNVGGSVCAIVMGSAQAPPAIYIGLTLNTAAASTADTTLTGELTNASGLGRAAGTFTNNAPATNSTVSQQASYQLVHTWTYTGSTAQAIAKIGCFDASANGNMWWEAVITTATVSANGDTVQITWTFNF